MSTGARSAALELLALIAVTGWLLHGFWNRLDLHPHDESFYLWQGTELCAGRWPAQILAWSPGLSATYALLASVLPRDVIPCDAMLILVNVASVAALWWALRPLLGPALATTMAIGWAGAETLLMAQAHNAHPTPYAWCSAWAFAAIGALVRGRFAWALGFLLIATVNRSEYSAWWIIWSGVQWFCDWRARRWSWRTVVTTAITAAVLVLASTDAQNARRWWAFRQHYDAVLARAAGENPAATDDERRLLAARTFAIETPYAERDFPGANSIPGAAFQNPRAMLAHLSRNAIRLPSNLWELWAGRFLWAPWLAMAWTLAFSIAALACIAAAPVTWWRRIRAWPRDGFVCMACTAAFVLVGVLTGPRTELLYPMVPLVTAAGGAGLARLRGLWLLPAMLLAALAIAGAPFPTAADPMVLRDAVHAVREHVPQGAARIVSLMGGVLPIYAARPDLQGEGPDPVRAEQEATRLAAAAADADWILVHPYLAPALPASTAALWRVAEERALHLVEFSPRCIVFGRAVPATPNAAVARPRALLRAALDAEAARREAALIEIGRRRSVAPEDEAPLLRCAEGDDSTLRWAAVWALGRLREPPAERDAILRRRLADDNGAVRAAACWALASCDPAAARELLPAPAAEASITGLVAREALAKARDADR